MDNFRNPHSEDIENFQPVGKIDSKMNSFQDDDVFGFEEETNPSKYVDSDTEEDNEEADEFNERQILQKRSSNQNLEKSIHIKTINCTNLHNNSRNNNKYSCSLPRDIISTRFTRGNEYEIDQQSVALENEDNRFDSDDELEKCGDMGQAISNLASSIVAKDGRELFGGVPSRRIPINSISQSYF